MSDKSGSARVNGPLWGARAADWASYQEQVHEAVYQAALEATGVGNGTGFLDVGCGAGRTIRLAVDRGAEATGLDAAEALLKIAAARTPTATFLSGDLENLPFEDGNFDVVSGINAFQYAQNPVAALSEARRVLAPDGRMAVAFWGNPEGMEAARLIAALKALMPPPPPGAPAPFAVSDKAGLRDFAREAGLETVEILDVESPFIYPDIEIAVRGMCSAGISVKVMETAGEAAVEQAYRDVFSELIQPDGTVRAGANFLCLIAKHAHQG